MLRKIKPAEKFWNIKTQKGKKITACSCYVTYVFKKIRKILQQYTVNILTQDCYRQKLVSTQMSQKNS